MLPKSEPIIKDYCYRNVYIVPNSGEKKTHTIREEESKKISIEAFVPLYYEEGETSARLRMYQSLGDGGNTKNIRLSVDKHGIMYIILCVEGPLQDIEASLYENYIVIDSAGIRAEKSATAEFNTDLLIESKEKYLVNVKQSAAVIDQTKTFRERYINPEQLYLALPKFVRRDSIKLTYADDILVIKFATDIL